MGSRCHQCGQGDPNMAVLDRETIGVPKRNPEDLSFNLCSSCVERLVIGVQEALKHCNEWTTGELESYDDPSDALRAVHQELNAAMLTHLIDQPKGTIA